MESLKKVCNQCPFRKDAPKGWLGAKRITDIVTETIEGDKYFVCHKTLDLPSSDQKLCAGKLILEGRENPYGNSSTRVGMALGLIPKDYSDIAGGELVFETKKECIDHHAVTRATRS